MKKTLSKSNWRPVTFDGIYSNTGLDPILAKFPDRLLSMAEKGGPDEVATAKRLLETETARRFQYSWRSTNKHPWTDTVKTMAQFVAAHGEGLLVESQAECHDLDDLLQCFNLIGEFRYLSLEAGKEVFKTHNLHRYYTPNNCNNCQDLYTYSIAWEGDLAIYVRAGTESKYLNEDWTRFSTEPLTLDGFKWRMMELGRDLGADESELTHESDFQMVWRFGWD
jgi:hypothetical protein